MERRIWRTVPTFTPRNETFDPTVRPFTEPGKKATNDSRCSKTRPDPNTITAATTSAIPLTTKLPMSAGLTRLFTAHLRARRHG